MLEQCWNGDQGFENNLTIEVLKAVLDKTLENNLNVGRELQINLEEKQFFSLLFLSNPNLKKVKGRFKQTHETVSGKDFH